MFASKSTRDVPLPSDPAVTVTIRKLSWLQRQAAMQIAQQRSRQDIKELGGMDEFRKLLSSEGGKASDAPAEAPDPFLTHDTLTVLVCGITSWSASEPVTKDTISDLDPDDAEGLARAILSHTLPAATLEADRKNAD